MGLFVQFLETIPKPDNQITIIFLQLNPDEIDKFAAAVVSIDVSTKLMAVATDDIVALYDIETIKAIDPKELDCREFGPIKQICLDHSGNVLAVVGAASVHLFNTSTLTPVYKLIPTDDEPIMVKFDKDLKRIFVLLNSGKLIANQKPLVA